MSATIGPSRSQYRDAPSVRLDDHQFGGGFFPVRSHSPDLPLKASRRVAQFVRAPDLGEHRSAGTRSSRQLATILGADVVGYSRLMGKDEAGTLARLRSHRRELIDPKVAGRRGRIGNTTGTAS